MTNIRSAAQEEAFQPPSDPQQLKDEENSGEREPESVAHGEDGVAGRVGFEREGHVRCWMRGARMFVWG